MTWIADSKYRKQLSWYRAANERRIMKLFDDRKEVDEQSDLYQQFERIRNLERERDQLQANLGEQKRVFDHIAMQTGGMQYGMQPHMNQFGGMQPNMNQPANMNQLGSLQDGNQFPNSGTPFFQNVGTPLNGQNMGSPNLVRNANGTNPFGHVNAYRNQNFNSNPFGNQNFQHGGSSGSTNAYGGRVPPLNIQNSLQQNFMQTPTVDNEFVAKMNALNDPAKIRRRPAPGTAGLGATPYSVQSTPNLPTAANLHGTPNPQSANMPMGGIPNLPTRENGPGGRAVPNGVKRAPVGGRDPFTNAANSTFQQQQLLQTARTSTLNAMPKSSPPNLSNISPPNLSGANTTTNPAKKYQMVTDVSSLGSPKQVGQVLGSDVRNPAVAHGKQLVLDVQIEALEKNVHIAEIERFKNKNIELAGEKGKLEEMMKALQKKLDDVDAEIADNESQMKKHELEIEACNYRVRDYNRKLNRIKDGEEIPVSDDVTQHFHQYNELVNKEFLGYQRDPVANRLNVTLHERPHLFNNQAPSTIDPLGEGPPGGGSRHPNQHDSTMVAANNRESSGALALYNQSQHTGDRHGNGNGNNQTLGAWGVNMRLDRVEDNNLGMRDFRTLEKDPRALIAEQRRLQQDEYQRKKPLRMVERIFSDVKATERDVKKPNTSTKAGYFDYENVNYDTQSTNATLPQKLAAADNLHKQPPSAPPPVSTTRNIS